MERQEEEGEEEEEEESAAVQGGYEGDCVALRQAVLQLPQQLPVRVVHQHQDPRPHLLGGTSTRLAWG